MDNLTIYTLLTAIRGFSNQITAKSLAYKLDVSYSTLARCKNGVWPRSIKNDAMKDVFEECRDKYFNGSDDALVHSTLVQLQDQSVDVTVLQAIYEARGYETFIDELLRCASDASHAEALTEAWHQAVERRERSQRSQAGGNTDAENDAPTEAVDTGNAKAEVNDREEWLRNVWLALPVAVILLMGLFNVSLTACLAWAAKHRGFFVGISLLIALLPALTGCLVDAPIAWLAYLKDNPGTPFSPKAFAYAAKYGSPNGYVEGRGRYDLSSAYLAYQPVCNVFGMFCYVSLFMLLLTLPGYYEFMVTREWVEYLKVALVVASLVAYKHMREQVSAAAASGRMTTNSTNNPDNYRLTRVHVWANGVHLIWTFSLLIVLLLALLAYSVDRYRSMDTPLLMLWPYLQSVLFFVYACTSHYAVKTRSTATGAFLPGVLITSGGFVALSLACYLPSWEGATLCAACLLNIVGAMLWWSKKKANSEYEAWFTEGRGSRAYSVAIAACIAVLFAIGVMTSALV